MGIIGDYELLTITDEIMGINPSSSAFAKSKARAAYRLQLALPHTDLYLHLFRSGGPRPHTLQVWKVNGSEAGQAAAIARAIAAAPVMASRQMAHGSWPEGRVGRTGTLSQQSTSHRLVDMSAEYTAVGKRLWVAYALPSGGDLSDVYADASETLVPPAPPAFSVFRFRPPPL